MAGDKPEIEICRQYISIRLITTLNEQKGDEL